jgi:hypothetical protein
MMGGIHGDQAEICICYALMDCNMKGKVKGKAVCVLN